MAKQPVKRGKKAVKSPKTRLVNRTSPVKASRAGDCAAPKPKKRVWQQKPGRSHEKYGTSKLEVRFARDFLDKLGVRYIYQYEMKSIGRYMDYYLPDSNLGIEVDGVWWHSKGLVYEQMTPTQKRNRRVDEEKNHWCLVNGIPLMRIWEDDINEHPEKVMAMLKERLSIADGEAKRKEDMRKRH